MEYNTGMKNDKIHLHEIERDIQIYLARMGIFAHDNTLTKNQKKRVEIYRLAEIMLNAKKQAKEVGYSTVNVSYDKDTDTFITSVE